jgi:hypothetical protein
MNVLCLRASKGNPVKRIIAGLVAAVVLASGLAAALAFASSSTGAAQPGRAGAGVHCPAAANPLPAEAVARAADQARIEAPHLYRGLGAAVVTQSNLAAYANARGKEVKQQCGSSGRSPTRVGLRRERAAGVSGWVSMERGLSPWKARYQFRQAPATGPRRESTPTAEFARNDSWKPGLRCPDAGAESQGCPRVAGVDGRWASALPPAGGALAQAGAPP